MAKALAAHNEMERRAGKPITQDAYVKKNAGYQSLNATGHEIDMSYYDTPHRDKFDSRTNIDPQAEIAK